MTRTSSKVLVAIVFAALYAVVGLVRHAHFASNAYDLGLFDQMVWHLGRFEAPASSIHGLSNMFGDHFSPIHVLYVPLSWLWPSAGSLIVTQAIFFGLSIVPVWVFLERRLPARPAMLMALSYALFWGLQRAAQFDVHEFAFAPLLIALLLLSLDQILSDTSAPHARSRFAGSALLLCLVKEDQIPLVAAVFALWAIRTKDAHDRRHAFAAAGVAVLLFLVVVRLVIPALNDQHAWAVGSAFADVQAHPLSLVGRLVWPAVKLHTLALWLLPFLFLPLLSSYGLLLIPLVLERFLSASPYHWGTSFHYSAPLAPILAMAAGDALGRLRSHVGPSFSSAIIPIAAGCLLLSAFLPGHQPIWKVFAPSFYQAPAFADVASRALSLIPADASVVAHSAIAPHLTRRQRIYMLRTEGPNANADADFVVAAPNDLSPWPFSGPEQLRLQMATYVRRGYVTVFEEQGWIVLARGVAR